MELDRLEPSAVFPKVEYSEWAAPVVPDVKTGGNVRICGDFKVTVNPVLQDVTYPLPKIEDMSTKLAGGQHFSTVNTHRRLYRYNRLPFAIKTPPAIWQHTIDQILQGIPGTEVLLDDIIVTGKTTAKHWSRLEMILKRLQEKNIRVNATKCAFFQD